MVKTQVYLTERERAELSALSSLTGKAQSELVREAVDDMLGRFDKARRAAALDNAAGMWKDRQDLPDFPAIRTEWSRGAEK